MRVNFMAGQEVTEHWKCSIEIPKEIADKGENDIMKYIWDNADAVEWHCLKDSNCNESMTYIDIENVED